MLRHLLVPRAGGWRRRGIGVAAALLALAASTSAAAQTWLGPAKCVQCHDHERQAGKWQREETAELKGKAHFATLKQLDGSKAAGFARAVGLADPYDLKGSCVKCHATVFRGDANAGVSCESCHGAASGYNELHQQKGSYARAVAAGMRDLREKPADIARLCVGCHVVSDARLVASGHPSGASFDAGASLQKLVHWNRAYNFALVTTEGRSAAGRMPAAASAAPAPVVPPPARSAPTPAGAAAPLPWDWSQPIRALPSDYVPEAVATPSVTPPPLRAPRPSPAVPPSIAEDAPLSPADAATVSAAPAPGVAGTRPRTAEVAELRGKGAALLERLLRAGARSPALPPPAKPLEFAGPDGELLHLQDEALALAIEALRRR